VSGGSNRSVDGINLLEEEILGAVVTFTAANFGTVTQLEECLPYKEDAGGSNPSSSTNVITMSPPCLRANLKRDVLGTG